MDKEQILTMIKSDYFDKDVDFSASDFCMEDYKLYVSKNYPKNEDASQSFKPWVGQLIHKASYDNPEIGVIKEFSFKFVYDFDYTIGGSIDRIANINGTWHIEDIKTQGNYPAQKSFLEPDKKWIIQLSIYRYAMLKYGFDISRDAYIHQFVLGYQKNKSGNKEYNKIRIELLSESEVEKLIGDKIEIAKGKVSEVDCPKWMCDAYCDWNESCPAYNYKGLL